MKRITSTTEPQPLETRADGLTNINFGFDGEGYWQIAAKDPSDPERLALRAVEKWTEGNILHGMTYRGRLVWLSLENQTNYFKAQEIANRTDGANLPFLVKTGNEGAYEVVEITTTRELNEFCDAVEAHIQKTLRESWRIKSNINKQTEL